MIVDGSIIVVDSIRAVVTLMNVYLAAEAAKNDTEPVVLEYLYGHTAAVNAILVAKNSRKTLKYKKYPLVFLRLDTPEEVSGGLYHFDLNIGIMTLTLEKYTPEERYNQNFRLKLLPWYQLFLKCVKQVGLFTWPGFQDKPPHTKFDRPFWGTQTTEGNVKDIFSDPLDCVELVNLRINQRIKIC